MMSKYYMLCLLFITCELINYQPAIAQRLSDSAFLERAFQNKNIEQAATLFNNWYSQSILHHQEESGNDTLRLVYKVYSRFMKDYIHKTMAGKKDLDSGRNYLFIQQAIDYLFIGGLSFEDLHYYFNSIFHHYGMLAYRDSISGYIRKTITRSHNKGTVKTIDPFYPDLKTIFFNGQSGPKPIYIRENNRLNTLIHFLGYGQLGSHVTSYETTDIMVLERRRKFLNSVLHFNGDYNQFISDFRHPFMPEVLNILIDSNMRYAMVEFYIGRTGGVYLAFYPVKLINSDRGSPLSWPLFAY